MSRDFTLKKYRELCNAMINSNYVILTLEEFLKLKSKPENYIILRHDVDIRPDYAIKMAELEKELGISSTYYIRITEEVFKPELINRLASVGHEVGYHYEALDKAKGNCSKAIQIFEKELIDFRKIHNAKTISMHGNSRTKWDNREMWKHYDFKSFGLLGEAYLSIDFDDIAYFTDTARTWSPKFKIKDMDPRYSLKNSNSVEAQIKTTINTTDDLIAIVKEKRLPHIYLLIHPDDWCDDYSKWLSNLIVRQFINTGKSIIRLYRMSA